MLLVLANGADYFTEDFKVFSITGTISLFAAGVNVIQQFCAGSSYNDNNGSVEKLHGDLQDQG
jgi:hypothetical protein